MSRTLNLVECLLTAARKLHQNGQHARALDLLSRLSRLRNLPDAVAEEAHALLGELYFRQDRFRKARRHLTAALLYRPDSADYHFRMAQAIEVDPDSRPERARCFYRRALELDPSNAQRWLDYGLYLLDLAVTKRGLRALRRAYALGAADPDLVGRVTRALRQEGLHDEAATKLRRCLFANPGDRRFRALWDEHQFALLSEQQRARRTNAAGGFGAPLLLPFTQGTPTGKYTTLGGKTIRLDEAAPLSEPKTQQRQPRRRPM